MYQETDPSKRAPDKRERYQGEFTVTGDTANCRLDILLSTILPALSRSQIKHAITSGGVWINTEHTQPSHRMRHGDTVTYDFVIPPAYSLDPYPYPITIVFEDQDIVVVDKPPGLVVHPAPGNKERTLVNALIYRQTPLASIGGAFRPGIVHRIDKDTSGLLVIAKTNTAYLALREQFSTHSIQREYLAIVQGKLKAPHGTIDLPIGRATHDRKKFSPTARHTKHAVTNYTSIHTYPHDIHLLKLTLETGRTHQIRVHMKAIGCPIVGDKVYGHRGNIPLARQALHATTLGITHPKTNRRLIFKSTLPEDMANLLTQL